MHPKWETVLSTWTKFNCYRHWNGLHNCSVVVAISPDCFYKLLFISYLSWLRISLKLSFSCQNAMCGSHSHFICMFPNQKFLRSQVMVWSGLFLSWLHCIITGKYCNTISLISLFIAILSINSLSTIATKSQTDEYVIEVMLSLLSLRMPIIQCAYISLRSWHQAGKSAIHSLSEAVLNMFKICTIDLLLICMVASSYIWVM